MCRIAGGTRSPRVLRRLLFLFAMVPAALLSIAKVAIAQTPADMARGFFKSVVGDWVGTSEQSTDGQRADDKYFHANVRQVDADTFVSTFRYYRWDAKAHTPVLIGVSTITTVIDAAGNVVNKIVGSGTILVDNQPRKQEHLLTEKLSVAPDGNLQGWGTGKIKVSGMPLGLGRNGKIRGSKSIWSLKDGVLRISQQVKAGFRALVVSKSFDVVANSAATRGSDVVSYVTSRSRVALSQ